MLSGYLLNTGIFLVAVILITLITCVLSDVLDGPKNTAGKLGSRTVLECTIEDEQQQWQDDYSGAVPPTISIDDRILPPYQGIYSVNGTAKKYDLILLSASYDNAGTHTCLDVFVSDLSSAEIIVLESDTTCTTNSTDKNNILIEGEYVYYMCNIRYKGLWGPKMTWTSNPGDGITPDDESDDTQEIKLLQHSFTTMVDSNNNGQSLRVVTSFDPPTSVPDPDNSANNAPDYTYTWDSPPITVHNPPTDIMLQHCTNDECDEISGSEITINPNDRIQASAAANPNVDYFKWQNDTDILQEGDKNEYTFTDIAMSNITCTVRNTMRDGLLGTSTRTIKVMVVATTTPPPTTTPISTIPSSPETSTATGGPPATDEIIEKDGLGAGAIAGIAIGVLAAIVICVIIIICVCRKSDKEKKANETMPPKKVHADQVRQPENNGPTTITNIDEKPPYDYNQYPENPYDNNVNPYAQDGRPNENLVYADLALDDTPRSRKPVQVFEPVQYAEIRRV